MYPVPVKSEAVETGGDCPPPPAYESIPHSDALHPSNGTASTEESHTASASRTPPPTTLSSSSIEASDQATSSNGN